MKPTATLAIAVLVAAVACAATAEDGVSQTFTGSYDWSDGGSDDLTAEFRSDGEGAWKVTFRFRWNGKGRTWSATAEGSLGDGTRLTGTATSGSRDWVFTATIRDGVMRGRHTELMGGGKRYETGTFEIQR